MIRNLYYNCCPFSTADFDWRDNIRMLCRYGRDIFNGKRIVIIRTGEGLAEPSQVEEAFADLGFHGVDFRLRPNNPELWETDGFIETLESLQSLDPEEFTFYAHTKGVRIAEPKFWRIESVRQWRNRMYHECLHDVNRVDAILSTFSAAGCFLLDETVPRKREWTKWMFCGTFFWFNHQKLFSKNWTYLGEDRDRFAVENYLGVHFGKTEVVSLFGQEQTAGRLYIKGVGVFHCPKCNTLFTQQLSLTKEHSCCSRPSTLLYLPQLGVYDEYALGRPEHPDTKKKVSLVSRNRAGARRKAPKFPANPRKT